MDPLTPCGWWVLGPTTREDSPLPSLHGEGRGLWRDMRAIPDAVLVMLAMAAYDQCSDFLGEAYDRLAKGPGPGHVYKAPAATREDPGGTARLYAWQIAQVRQMQAAWRASVAQAGGEMGDGEFSITVYPMNKEIKDMLRPPTRAPYFGGGA